MTTVVLVPVGIVVGIVAVFLGLPLAWRRFGQPGADRRTAARTEAALAGRSGWVYHPDATAEFAEPVPMQLPYAGRRRVRWALAGPLPAGGFRSGARDRARVVEVTYHQSGRTSSMTDVHVAVLELDRHVSTFELRRVPRARRDDRWRREAAARRPEWWTPELDALESARGLHLTDAWRPETAQALLTPQVAALLERQAMSVRFFSDRAVAWTSRRMEPGDYVTLAESVEELASLLPAFLWEG